MISVCRGAIRAGGCSWQISGHLLRFGSGSCPAPAAARRCSSSALARAPRQPTPYRSHDMPAPRRPPHSHLQGKHFSSWQRRTTSRQPAASRRAGDDVIAVRASDVPTHCEVTVPLAERARNAAALWCVYVDTHGITSPGWVFVRFPDPAVLSTGDAPRRMPSLGWSLHPGQATRNCDDFVCGASGLIQAGPVRGARARAIKQTAEGSGAALRGTRLL